jgi:hypothetical protein
MDSGELRAGNLIEVEGLIVRVADVCNAEKEITAVTPDDKKITTSMSAVKPISLADRALEQYCNLDEDGYIVVGIDSHRYYLKIKDGYIILLSRNSEPLIHFWDVRYVHQLQNLYHALKGQEMAIVFG